MLEGFINNLKFRYTMIFHYGSKKLAYIILKTILIILFTLPFFAYEIFDFVVELILLIPSFIPIICIPARIICYILSSIGSLLFMLIALPDIIFDSENAQALDDLNSSGYLR